MISAISLQHSETCNVYFSETSVIGLKYYFILHPILHVSIKSPNKKSEMHGST